MAAYEGQSKPRQQTEERRPGGSDRIPPNCLDAACGKGGWLSFWRCGPRPSRYLEVPYAGRCYPYFGSCSCPRFLPPTAIIKGSILDSLDKLSYKNARNLGILVTLAVWTLGCGLPKRELESHIGLGGAMSLEVNTSRAANSNSPVALDIVAVSDKKLMPVLAKLSAAQWFERRSQILLDHPGKVEILADLELVPGQHYGPLKLKAGPKFIGGILFANYFTPGAHRAVVDIRKPLVIKLRQNNFAIQRPH